MTALSESSLEMQITIRSIVKASAKGNKLSYKKTDSLKIFRLEKSHIDSLTDNLVQRPFGSESP